MHSSVCTDDTQDYGQKFCETEDPLEDRDVYLISNPVDLFLYK